MRKEEAVKLIDTLIESERFRISFSPMREYDSINNLNAITLAKEALVKQIPRKPYTFEDESGSMLKCPICETFIRYRDELSHSFLQNNKYCAKCGQAFDWSIEKIIFSKTSK